MEVLFIGFAADQLLDFGSLSKGRCRSLPVVLGFDVVEIWVYGENKILGGPFHVKDSQNSIERCNRQASTMSRT